MAYYRKKQLQKLIDWTPDFPMELVSISEADKNNGSPKEGDKIAFNPKDPTDIWLVAKQFFDDNYEFVSETLLPSFTYFLNMTGPRTLDWYSARGLVKDGQPIHLYAGGRIDIRGDTGTPWGVEYGVPPMLMEDWNAFGAWLRDLETTEQWDYDMLISIFEGEVLNGRKIRWAK